MSEQYQGLYVFRCGSGDHANCLVMAIEERKKRGNGLSSGVELVIAVN